MNRFLRHACRSMDVHIALAPHNLILALDPSLCARAERAVAAGAKPQMWRLLRRHAVCGPCALSRFDCVCPRGGHQSEGWTSFNLGEALVLAARPDYPFQSSDGTVHRRICLLDRDLEAGQSRVSALGILLGQRVIHDWIVGNAWWFESSSAQMSTEQAACAWAKSIRTCPLDDQSIAGAQHLDPPDTLAEWVVPDVLTVRCVMIDAKNVCCRLPGNDENG